MYCTCVEVLLWGGRYVLSLCGGSVVGKLLYTVVVCMCGCVRLLCTVLVWRCSCENAAMYCPCVEVLM